VDGLATSSPPVQPGEKALVGYSAHIHGNHPVLNVVIHQLFDAANLRDSNTIFIIVVEAIKLRLWALSPAEADRLCPTKEGGGNIDTSSADSGDNRDLRNLVRNREIPELLRRMARRDHEIRTKPAASLRKK